MSDVSFASVQAPCTLWNVVSFRRGEAEGPRHRDEKDDGRPRQLEKAAKGDGGEVLEALNLLTRAGKLSPEEPHFLTKSPNSFQYR